MPPLRLIYMAHGFSFAEPRWVFYIRTMFLRWFGLAALLAAVGCTPSVMPPRVTSPFTEQDGVVFDDGVDFIGDPTVLEGRWREEWSRDLDYRISSADLVAVVSVHTLRTDVDPGRRTTFRIVTDVERELLGRRPADEIVLTTRAGTRGYATVQENQRRILETDHVMYLKWYETDIGAIAAHWHLSPASEPIINRTIALIQQRRSADATAEEAPEAQVIVHEN